MATKRQDRAAHDLQFLRNGDCMDQYSFHRAYEQMPSEYRAELIGGIVFEPSPVSYRHGEHHSDLNFLFKTYCIATAGVKVVNDATVILGPEDELQPDLTVFVSQECGGQSHLNKKGYIEGAPELVAEIAYSRVSIDLHLKRHRYTQAGVVEYLVVCLKPEKIYWLNLQTGKNFRPDFQGVYRSKVFPGLWIHGPGLLSNDDKITVETLQKGLDSLEHRKLAERLARGTK